MDYFPELFEPESSIPIRFDGKSKVKSIRHFLKILTLERERSKSRNTYSEIMNIRLRNLKHCIDPRTLLADIFESIIGRLSQNLHRGQPAKISLQINNPYMDSPFYIPLRDFDQNNPDSLASEFLKLARQSGGKFKLFSTTSQLKVFGVWPLRNKKVHIVQKRRKWRKIAGSCWQKSTRLYGQFITGKRSGIVEIFNDDNLCMTRALALGMTRAMYGEKAMKQLLADPNGKQKEIAILLLRSAGISHTLKSYNLNHLKAVQRALDNKFPGKYRLAVFWADKMFKLVFKGKKPADFTIPLLYHGMHFDLICSTKKLFKTWADYCYDCESLVYPNSHTKDCIRCCQLCYGFGKNFPCKGDRPIKCTKCGFFFPNMQCFLKHEKKGKNGGSSICMNRFFCKDCNKVVYKRGRRHQCQFADEMPFRCEKCGVLRQKDDQHYCYVQPYWLLDKIKGNEEEDEQKQIRFCFFDVETTQDKKVAINGVKCRKHIPNLIIAEIICSACADDENVQLPTGPNSRQNPNLRAKKCNCNVFGPKFRYLKNLVDPENRRLLKFDAFYGGKSPEDQFLEFLLTQGDPAVKTVIIGHNAAKFDLHLLLTAMYRRNISPRLTMTGLKIYKAEIKRWNERGLLFKDSLCFLPGALSRLYETFSMEGTGVQRKPPFPHLFNKIQNLHKSRKTLPPLKYYSIKRMKEEEYLQLLEWHGANKHQGFDLMKELVEYCKNDVQLLRIACLKFRKIILHLCPGLDPFISCSTIAGLAVALWRTRFLPPNTMANLPENGLRPFTVQSNEAKRFFAVFTKITGLKVRSANSAKGEFVSEPDDDENSSDDEKGIKDGKFRVDGFIESATGQPTILEYNGCRFHGCVFCFPDRKMPLQGGKTAEDLYARSQMRKMEMQKRGFRVMEVWECRWKAMLKKNARIRKLWKEIKMPPPPLNPRRDCLRGGRVEPFRLYAETGPDEVIEIYDILWHFPDQQWTDFGKGRDLFREYINQLLKIKVESSGWPSHIKTEEQKRAFIEEYKQREGIDLDPENMVFNKGLREIIKLLLNSLWGKLCQRVNMSSVKITRSAREFHELVFDKTIEVIDAVHINSHMDRIVFRRKENFAEFPETNNVPIAACITANGRRLLYRTIMEAVKLDNELLYCDTDSLMIKRKVWQRGITEGMFLGNMTRELPNRKIEKIVMAGAKNYAFLHSNIDGEQIKLTRKIRGFEMTNVAAKQLTFEAILKQVKEQFFEKNSKSSVKKSIAIKYSSFRRTTKGMVYVRPMQKEYMAVYKKGIVRKLTEQIVPFGYKDEKK